MSQRLAQAAARVHELARALVASAQAARQEATALERALDERRRPSPPPAPAPVPPAARPETSSPNGTLPGDIDAARLIAIELADGGSSREEVERHLRARFGGLAGDGLQGVLDDVFGPARRAG
jgi:hypothetical protein